jgi:hypothetical protein
MVYTLAAWNQFTKPGKPVRRRPTEEAAFEMMAGNLHRAPSGAIPHVDRSFSRFMAF